MLVETCCIPLSEKLTLTGSVEWPAFFSFLFSPLKLIRISCGKICGGTKQFSDKHILFEVSVKAVSYLNVHFCWLVWTDLFWTNRVHSTVEKSSQVLSP